ncbi:cAMP dependent protein kinase [Trametopsis cervina]|nr:cAMP dependent protein kinase [Trametopsis cervina]
MDQTPYPPFRSTSLPLSIPMTLTAGDFLAQNVSVKRDSMFMITDGPMTPPLSPARSEDEEHHQVLPPHTIDTQTAMPQDTVKPAVLQVTRPVPGSRRASREVLQSEERMKVDAKRMSVSGPAAPPIRHLEDEQSHVQKGGSLRLTDFEVKGTLGTGTFGRVLLVKLRDSPSTSHNHCFAMKVLRKSEIVRLRQVEHVNAERYILSRVQHPFIVDLYATFQDSMNIYMMLSYVPGGELFTHLRRAQRFTPDVTRFYLATIILALKYLHSFNIIYRDLKPENLLLDSHGYVRITDFGFAKIVDDRTWTLCGTPEYLAPEIIQSDGHGKAADWWACGILAYEMMVGYPPFFDETAYGIYEKILRGKIHWPKDMDPLSREIIKAFLHPDRSKRLGNLIGGAQDILEHPWFRGVDWRALERREIRAPIIPHVTSLEDTRHFSRLPLPPAEEIPGLLREESPRDIHELFEPAEYQFLEF